MHHSSCPHSGELCCLALGSQVINNVLNSRFPLAFDIYNVSVSFFSEVAVKLRERFSNRCN